MRILITGGAGFIGSHVLDACLRAGHEVVALDDLSGGKRENVAAGARLEVLDIRDAAAVDRVFAGFRPEAVSHQAAQVSVSVSTREPRRDAEINVLGSISVLEACVRHGTQRLVFASTGGAIYGEVEEGRRAAVGDVERPLSPYAVSKRAVELYLARYEHEHGLRSTVLRYANVYGPRQDPHGEAGVVAIFSERILADAPIQVYAKREPGDGGCIRDYVFVADVVRANLRALEGRIEARIANVATGEATTTLALAQAIASAAGKTPSIGHAGRRVGDLERSVLSPSPESTDAPPTPLAEGIAATVAHFRAHRRAAV